MSELNRILSELDAMKKPRRHRKGLHIGEDRARRLVKEYVAMLPTTSAFPEMQETELFNARMAMVHGARVTWGGH